MKFIFWVSVVVALALVWSLWGRNWLKARGWRWSNAFFAFIEPIEIMLWKNSKTIFVARLKIATGLLLMVGAQLGAIDITPLMPFVPDEWEGVVRFAWQLLPLTIAAVGWMDEALRKETTKPLALVAVPEDAPADVKQAVAQVEAENRLAVEVVKDAKTAGQL